MNSSTVTGDTALMLAAEKGKYEVVALLLKSGANINTKVSARTISDDRGRCCSRQGGQFI